MLIKRRHESKCTEEGLLEGICEAPCIPPGASSVCGGLPCPGFRQSAFHQVTSPSVGTVPTSPDETSQSPADPAVKLLKDVLHLRKPEAVAPTAYRRSKLARGSFEAPSPTTAKEFLHSPLEPFH